MFFFSVFCVLSFVCKNILYNRASQAWKSFLKLRINESVIVKPSHTTATVWEHTQQQLRTSTKQRLHIRVEQAVCWPAET